MNTNMRCGRMRAGAMVLVALVMGAAGVVGVAGGAPGAPAAAAPAKYASPAAVLAAYEKAHDANDDAAGVDCLSPDGQDKSLKFMIGMEMMTRQTEPGAPPPSAEEKKANADVDALLAKYGAKDLGMHPGEAAEAYVNRIVAIVTDRRMLLMKMMKSMTGPEKQAPCLKGELKDLTITGDTASGKYAVKQPDGSSMGQDLKFQKIDGSWRLADVVMLSSSDTSDPTAASGGAAGTQPAKP